MTTALKPPRVARRSVARELHGETRVDEYAWLRERDDPAVLAHLRAENRYAAAYLRPHAELHGALYREMRQRFRDEDAAVPERLGPFHYYWRYRRGERYRVFCRRTASPRGPEQVLLDPNAVAGAAGAAYLDLGCVRVSPDHRRLAYTIDLDGGERYAAHVVDLDSGQPAGAPFAGVADELEWAADSATLLLCRLNARGQPRRALLHQVGADPATATSLYRERDERFFVGCSRSRSGRFLFVTAASGASSEVWYLEADAVDRPLRLIRERRAGHEYAVAHHGRYFYLVTNEDAVNFKVARAPLRRPGEWRDFLPHRPERLVERIQLFAGHLVVFERWRGLRRIRVVDLASGRRHFVEFDEPAYTIVEHDNPEFASGVLRFSYSSPLTPRTVIDYDMATRERRVRKTAEVRGGYTPAAYRLERIFATAADGARVPITVIRRRGARRDGRSPLYLYAYGSYGRNVAPAFAAERFSLIDRGFVYAIAHLRGGQELGRPWYAAGKLLDKWNTFNDYLACSDHLIAERYTAAGRIVAAGVSAGGMVAAVAANERPALYRAVVTHVPFVDVLNTMLDPTQALTAFEYDEWGNPADPIYYRYIRSYSPYDNVRRQPYPRMLILGSYNDPRVPYWEPAKWVARLRELKTDDRPILLKTAMSAGHAGRSGRFEELKEAALEYTFVLDAFGMAGPPGVRGPRRPPGSGSTLPPCPDVPVR